MLRSDWRAYNDAHPDKPLANARLAWRGRCWPRIEAKSPSGR